VRVDVIASCPDAACRVLWEKHVVLAYIAVFVFALGNCTKTLIQIGNTEFQGHDPRGLDRVVTEISATWWALYQHGRRCGSSYDQFFCVCWRLIMACPTIIATLMSFPSCDVV
jgi:hypothetical protein